MALAARGAWTIRVQSPWYEALASGVKAYEGRLNRDSYAAMKPGDTVLVEHDTVEGKSRLSSLRMKVIDVLHFTDFRLALSSLPLASVLPGVADVDAGCAAYAHFYSREAERACGVLMIQLRQSSEQSVLELSS